MSRGVRVAVAATVVLAVGATIAAATGFDAGLGNDDKPTDTSSGLPPATAQVTRQTLVDTQTETGDLGYGDETAVGGRLVGTVTALPAAGATIQRGQTIYQVDNTPVVLLYGPLPAYRALNVGTEGADVKQFEENLYALGYRGFTVDNKYSETTATAVKKWQGDLGLSKTGTVELGRISYSDGPSRVNTLKAAVGDELKPGTALFTYTGSARVVTVELGVSSQRLARKDAVVSVKLPDGKSVGGKIAKTATVVKPAEGQNPAETKIDVTISIDDEKALAGLDQAAVDVGFTASQKENVLTVPVAALLALAEGGYGVQVIDGTTTRTVAVETGMFAGGRVEITGVTEGVTVGMPS